MTSKAKGYRDRFYPSLCKPKLEHNLGAEHFVSNMPFPFNCLGQETDGRVQPGLSRIVRKLLELMVSSTSKHLIVSTHFPTLFKYLKGANYCF